MRGDQGRWGHLQLHDEVDEREGRREHELRHRSLRDDHGHADEQEAAHQLADALFANQRALSFRATYGPKVHGGSALNAACWYAPLRCFYVYSSIAGLMGAAGQTPHSAANTCLDAMARWRRSRGVRGQGVSWGAVSEIGYAARLGADRRAEVSGSGVISRYMAMVALRR